MQIINTEVYKKLEEWGAWRISGEANFYPGGGTLMGKALASMPSTKCIHCNGAGRVKAPDFKHSGHYVKCSVCGGNGKIDTRSTLCKINPAFIHSTTSDAGAPVNVVADFIQHIVGRLLYLQEQVVYIEFTSDVIGTYSQKGARVKLNSGARKYLMDGSQRTGRKGVTKDYYRMILRRALINIENKLIEKNILFVKQLG